MKIMHEINTDINVELSKLAQQVSRSMVRLEGAGRGLGTGTIWHPRGLLITNAHVAAAGPLKAVMQDGRRLPVKLIGIDRNTDVAALQVDEELELEAIPIGDARSLRPGELVFSMGFPWGMGSGLTIGSVIGISSESGVSGNGDGTWLVAGLHLRPGHSGGPMFNTAGELVGLNTVMQGPDVGVAIPVHQAARAIKGFWTSEEKIVESRVPIL